jgi:pimeloyl-ACP methyl ester carboxylesterase
MAIKQCLALNGKVRLRYLDSGSESDHSPVPLVFVPGMLGNAEQFLDEFAQFAPRRCLSVSLRGRGKSDAPARNYNFFHHVSDLATIITWSKAAPCCLMGHSVGAAYALGYAVGHPDQLKGVIVLDYPARYPAFPPAWTERALASGSVPKERARVLHRLQLESSEVLLWEKLPQLTCPVLVIRGEQEGALLDAAGAARYQTMLPQARIEVFADSVHAPWEPDYGRFITTIKAFLQTLDT